MSAKYCQHCGNKLVLAMRGGVERQVCMSDDCGRVFWNNPIPVLAGIVEYNGHIILIQNKGWPKNWYGLVTGFLEKGESPEDGMVREIHEELGLVSEIREYVGTYSFFKKNELILAYHAVAQGEIVKGEELADFKQVPIDKVKPWPFATGLALRDWLERRTSN